MRLDLQAMRAIGETSDSDAWSRTLDAIVEYSAWTVTEGGTLVRGVVEPPPTPCDLPRIRTPYGRWTTAFWLELSAFAGLPIEVVSLAALAAVEALAEASKAPDAVRASVHSALEARSAS